MSDRSQLLAARCGETYFVRIIGRGTYRGSLAFRQFVASCLHRGATVIVDLQECDFLDSTFLGCLIGLNKTGRHVSPPRLVFWADAARRVQLFATSMLDRVLDFTDSCPLPPTELVAIEGEHLDERELGQHIMQCHRRLAELGGRHAETYRSVADRLADELGE